MREGERETKPDRGWKGEGERREREREHERKREREREREGGKREKGEKEGDE